MDPFSVLGFAGTVLALIAVPGPDWAFILAAGARDRVIWPAVSGLAAGYAVITIAVALGVGALITAAPALLTALTVVGAAYLTYLGIRTLRGASHAAVHATEPDQDGARAYALRGMAASGLNPKGLLIFVAILPQFARPAATWPVALQLSVLGAVFILIAGAFYLVLGHAAARVLAARPSVARATARIAGIAMILVGVLLLIERVAQVTSD